MRTSGNLDDGLLDARMVEIISLQAMSKDLIKKPAKWLARETLGNFIYDQLGALWRSAIMAALAALVIRFLSSIPLDIRLVAGLFVLALAFLSLERFISNRRNKHLTMVASATAVEQVTPMTDILADTKILDERNARIQELENDNFALTNQLINKEAEFSSFKKQYEWLHQIAGRDKRNIAQYVYVIFHKVNYEGLAELSPYIEIIFYIINASVYRITIDKTIQGGAVYLNGVELNPKQANIEGSLEYISRDDRGEKRLLIIKQWLTDREAERFRKPLSDDKLSFSRLKLNVKGADDAEGVEPQRLSFPSSVPITLPLTSRNQDS